MEKDSSPIQTEIRPVDSSADTAKRKGMPKAVIVGLILSLIPYIYSLCVCVPSITQPKRHVWAEGLVFASFIPIFFIPLNAIALALSIPALKKKRNYEKESVIAIIAITTIVLSLAFFLFNSILVDVAHSQIVRFGGY